MEERYFIVFFSALSSDGDIAKGINNVTSSNGYPTLKGLNNLLKNDLQMKSPSKTVVSINITNIIELNNEDYRNWTGE